MATLRSVVPHMVAKFEAGDAVMAKGHAGIGKTWLSFQLFEQMKRMYPNERCGMGRIFMATQTSVDILGLPWKSERDFGDGIVRTITDPAMPMWFMSTEGKPLSMYDRVLMVFEEWGQGEPEVKKAVAPIVLEGGVREPYFLPQGSWKLLLTNIDKRDGVTKEFDFLFGRYTEFTISPNVEEWLEDFADKPYQWQGKTWQVTPLTKAWIKKNPQCLLEPKPEKQGPWCNPRTATANDRYIQNVIAQSGGKLPLGDPLLVEGCAGHIGMPSTESFLSFAKFQLELPQYDEVVADPAGCPVPTKADLLLLMAYQLAGWARPDEIGEVIEYVERMPKDMRFTFVTALMRRDSKSFINQPAMAAWVGKNAALLNIIASIAKA